MDALTYRPQGSTPPLCWLIHRLSERGLPPSTKPIPSWIPEHWQGISLPGIWVNLSTEDQTDLLARRQTCHHYATTFIELNGLWQPLGKQLGFMLLTGSEITTIPRPAQQLLDALAPFPGAWLHCGPIGSALFTQHVISTLLLSWQAFYLDPPKRLDWKKYWQQQWDTAKQLQRLARDYLATFAPNRLTAEDSPPHFATNLARLILLVSAQSNYFYPTTLLEPTIA